jgi:Domain of unknown function (DUF1902)
MQYMLSVDIFYDNQAKVWVGHAQNEGIISEAQTKEQLIARLQEIVPDVLQERFGEIKTLTILINPINAPELTKIAA